MTQDAFKTILDHQGQLRKLIEEMILELRLLQDLSRQVAVLDTRVSSVERFQAQILEDCKECRASMNGKISTVQSQFREDSKESVQIHQSIRKDVQAEVKSLDKRLDQLEKKAAELGGRYGVIGSVLTLLMIEAIRWFIHVAKQ
jgi:chromosome segregation ATPase